MILIVPTVMVKALLVIQIICNKIFMKKKTYIINNNNINISKIIQIILKIQVDIR